MNSRQSTMRPLHGLNLKARRRQLAWVAGLVCGLAGMVAGSPETRMLEYEVKAAFLVKFGSFVEWSTNAPAGGNSGGFKIGILGEDPFGETFDEAVKKIKINAQPVHILRGQQPAELIQCQIVFICTSEAARLGELIGQLSGRGILTVADEPDFARRGGMIGFVKEAGRVRFEINPGGAEKSGLKLSSKLLQIGRRVAAEDSAS